MFTIQDLKDKPFLLMYFQNEFTIFRYIKCDINNQILFFAKIYDSFGNNYNDFANYQFTYEWFSDEIMNNIFVSSYVLYSECELQIQNLKLEYPEYFI